MTVKPASSQITSSPYSVFGLGNLDGTQAGTGSAMGGTGIAFLSEQSLNLKNPASIGGLDSLITIFEIGFAGTSTLYVTGNTRQSLFDANFRYIAMGFRIAPRWAVDFGVRPYSSIGYTINESAYIEGTNQTYNKTFSGSGGVNQVFLGNSYKILRNLNLGINVGYLFGTLTHSESSDFTYYSLVNQTYLSNVDLNFGLNYQLVRDKWKYNIGLTFDNGKSLYTKNVSTLITSVDHTTLKTTGNDLKVPQSFGIGLAFEKDFLRGGIDFEKQRWQDIVFENSMLATRNTNRLSMGFEIPSLGERRNGSRMIFYRFGAEYSQSYMVIKGFPINYRSVSFGAGIPVKGALSALNLSLELGKNGTNQGGLTEENFCTLHLDLSLKELWFVKRKYD